MGKKKKKKKKNRRYSGNCGKSPLKDMGNQFNDYLSAVDTFVIKEEMRESSYHEAIDNLKELIKKLKKGDVDDVFESEEMYEKAITAARDGKKYEQIDYDYY